MKRINTFEHVVNGLMRIIPGISEKKSCLLALEVMREGRQKYGEYHLNW
tara:strand:+ start:1096 stop:1242 length:147 start_codon:yes stop_codon:yes gene_type:complete